MDWFFKMINPAEHWTQASYEAWWRTMLQTTLLGFWGKFFAAICIAIAIWFGVRRGMFQVSLGFLGLATLIMFGGGIWFSIFK